MKNDSLESLETDCSTARQLSRRRFLQTTALAGLAAPFVMPSGLRAAAPNSKLNHASIGVGGLMGGIDLKSFLRHSRVQVVALCDVDAKHLEEAAKLVPGARLYSDWRELLEKEGDKIDSVNVTVPDHMHFPIAYSAIQKGKHVYCQKPMCHDVAEVRALTEAAVKKRVVTQLGTQARLRPRRPHHGASAQERRHRKNQARLPLLEPARRAWKLTGS